VGKVGAYSILDMHEPPNSTKPAVTPEWRIDLVSIQGPLALIAPGCSDAAEA